MNVGPSDERLSAYLDREATSAERDAVENLLEASPDARAELEAFSELSQLLKTLPHQPAPVDFSHRVMHRIAEASSAVPPEAVAQTTTPVVVAGTLARKSYRREWLSAFAGAMVSAAALLLAIGPQTRQVTNHASTTQTESAAPLDDQVLAPVAMVAADADGLQGVDGPGMGRDRLADEFGGTKTQHRRLVTSDHRVRKGEAAKFTTDAPDRGAAASAVPVVMPKLAEPAVELDAKSNSPQIPLSDFLANWTTLDVNGQYVANVDLEVVDVERSADMLQVLLVRNGVAKVTNTWEYSSDSQATSNDKLGARANNPDAGEAATKKQKVVADDSELIAVYVESDQDALLKSLEQLSQNHMVLRTRLQPPLPYFDLPIEATDENRRPFNDAQEKRSETRELAEQESLQRKVTNVARAYNFQQFGIEPNFGESDLKRLEDAPVSALDAWNDQDWLARASSSGNQRMKRNGQPEQPAAAEKPLAAAVTRPTPAAKGAPISAAPANSASLNSFNTKIVLANTIQANELKSRLETNGSLAIPPLGTSQSPGRYRQDRLSPPAPPMGGAAGSPAMELQRERMMMRNSGADGNRAIGADAARQQSANTIRVLFVMIPGAKDAVSPGASSKP